MDHDGIHHHAIRNASVLRLQMIDAGVTVLW
jgi:hypothetical protein